MTRYEKILKELPANPKTWLVTGVAGFIGSNLLETLLALDQKVIGLDNFATGHQHNLDEVKGLVTPEQWGRFTFLKGDINNLEDCHKACADVDYVLHQAALGSVPRSIDDPVSTNNTNVGGFLNMLVAAREAKVKRFTYAASSSTYGDHPSLPKSEEVIGNPLSPYAVTKYVNELYSQVFSRVYGFHSVGLRYFNVFGPRQDPKGAYAAVIPRWIKNMIDGKPIAIYGDGETSRDFCYIDNTVQMNILSVVGPNLKESQVFNVAVGQRTTLNRLYSIIDNELKKKGVISFSKVVKESFRDGDVRHSEASIEKAEKVFGYHPSHTVEEGLIHTIDWYCRKENS